MPKNQEEGHKRESFISSMRCEFPDSTSRPNSRYWKLCREKWSVGWGRCPAGNYFWWNYC